MLQSGDSKEYKRLYAQFIKMPDDKLAQIIEPENGYTDIAMKVASDILHSDRTELDRNTAEQEAEENTVEQQKAAEMQKPDKEDMFFGLCNDIHTIKNILLFFLILTLIGMLYGFYTVFVTIPNLF